MKRHFARSLAVRIRLDQKRKEETMVMPTTEIIQRLVQHLSGARAVREIAHPNVTSKSFIVRLVDGRDIKMALTEPAYSRRTHARAAAESYLDRKFNCL